MTLLDSAGYHEVNAALTRLSSPFPNQPYSGEDSPSQLARLVRGDPGEPYATEKNKNQGRWGGRSADLAYLILSLWACAKSLTHQSDKIFNQAIGKHHALYQTILGDENEAENPDSSQEMWPEYEPQAVKAIFSAWLTLAEPLLTPDDRLWTPLESRREEATLALSGFTSVKAKIWPEKNSLS
jgi:hypothetical protein